MKLFGGVIPITGITFFMFSIFAIIAVGFALGRITIKGISLGDAGVFIIALVFGCLFYSQLDAQLTLKVAEGLNLSYTSQALKIVENLGLILFVTSVLVSWWLLVGVTPVWIALMVWQFIRLKKEIDAKKKGKTKFLIALINLLPTIAALTTIFIIGSMLGL